jgi:NADH:ubiquinone oxidoreductase subunit 3 (subunit A)
MLRHLRGGPGDLIWFIVAEMFVFIAFLLLGYVYILKRRALEWE